VCDHRTSHHYRCVEERAPKRIEQESGRLRLPPSRVKNAHGLKDTVARIDDTRNHAAWQTVGTRPSAVLQIWKENLQYELICDDRKFATLGLKIRGDGNPRGDLYVVDVKAKRLGELQQPSLDFRLKLFSALNRGL
jgi:hypothetical protein